jgi:hypothetical protein
VLDIQAAGEIVCPEHMIEVVVEPVPVVVVVRDIDVERARDGAVEDVEEAVVDDGTVGSGMGEVDDEVVELPEDEGQQIVDRLHCSASSSSEDATSRVQGLLPVEVMAKGLGFCRHCPPVQTVLGTVVVGHHQQNCGVDLANTHLAMFSCPFYRQIAHATPAPTRSLSLFFSYAHRDEFELGSPVQQRSEKEWCFLPNQETSSR